MEKAGIKETKEVIVAANALVALLITRLRDGVGIDDAVAIISKLSSDAEFIKKMNDAYDKVGDVTEEIKDLSLVEFAQLAAIQAAELPKIIGAIHGKPE